MVLAGVLAGVLGVHIVGSALSGRRLVEERVEREEALPLVGKAPMHAVYRALRPVATVCVALGVSANMVSLASLGLAVAAAVALATGHFGIGAGLASAGALADAVDGLVARLSGTSSKFGKVLDTTIDRYVDALLLGGLAVYVRESVVLLVLCMAAIVGSFMVSYASAVVRELGVADRGFAMRRAHRLAYLLTGAALVPVVQHLLPAFQTSTWSSTVQAAVRLSPMLFAAAAIAVLGNIAALRRLFAAAAASEDPEFKPEDSSGPRLVVLERPVPSTPREVAHR